MKILIPFQYTESVVPPRCRKPRDVQRTGEVEIWLPEISSGEAPVAIVAERGQSAVESSAPDVVWRWYEGRLWTRCRTYNGEAQAYTSRGTDWDYPDVTLANLNALGLTMASGTRREVEQSIEQWAEDTLVIDGHVYRRAPEPMYAIRTFGLGSDHGGTSICVLEFDPTSERDASHFAADQLVSAQAYGKNIAAERGDVKNVHLDPNPRLEVILPEALKRSRPEPPPQFAGGTSARILF